jgi:hypothetical protein
MLLPNENAGFIVGENGIGEVEIFQSPSASEEGLRR